MAVAENLKGGGNVREPSFCHAVMSCNFCRGGSFLSLGDQEEIVAVE
jgi:hypothetical protein